ncbi:MAG: gas vesicle protein K [Candidatus Diapherotrites archaeon]
MVTKIDLKNDDKESLKNGVMGLVLAIVEVIRDALRLQAIRRIEGGSLTEEEEERLGRALEDFDEAIEKMKEEQGLNEATQSVRNGLDDLANDLVNNFLNEEQIKAADKGGKLGK